MAQRLKTEDLPYKDIFNISFEIFKNNIKSVIVLGILIFLPMIILDYFVFTPDLIERFSEEFTDYFQNIMLYGQFSTRLPQSFLIISVLTMTKSIIFLPLVAAGLTGIALSYIQNGHVKPEDYLANSIGKMHKLVFTSFIVSIITIIGLSLFILPGVYYAVVYTFIAQAVVVSGNWGLSALRESSYIVSGKWFRTVGLLGLIYLFGEAYNYITRNLVSAIFLIIPYNQIIDSFFSLIFSVFTMYLYMVKSVWFINKRNINRGVI